MAIPVDPPFFDLGFFVPYFLSNSFTVFLVKWPYHLYAIGIARFPPNVNSLSLRNHLISLRRCNTRVIIKLFTAQPEEQGNINSRHKSWIDRRNSPALKKSLSF